MVKLPVDSLATPPPKAAVLPVIARFDRSRVPELSMAPPFSAANPPVIVKPEIEAVTPVATEKTVAILFPLIETKLAPGPWMAFATLVPLESASASVPRVSVNAPVMVKNTVFAAGLAILAGLALVLILAQPTPVRSVPVVSASTFVETTYDELASYAPMSTLDPAFKPPGPRRPPR